MHLTPKSSIGKTAILRETAQMSSPLAIIGLFLLALTSPPQTLEVAAIPVNEQVLVSLKLGEGFSSKVAAAVHAGRTVTLFYKIELRRTSPFWFDRTLDTALVTVTIRYDHLARKYQITRLFDGVPRMQAMGREEFVRERLIADFEALPLFKTVALQARTEYHIRVRPVRSSWASANESAHASFRLR